MNNNLISIKLDLETYKMAKNLAKLSNISVPEMIKELIKSREHLYKPEISEGVKGISGILKTDQDYSVLRDLS